MAIFSKNNAGKVHVFNSKGILPSKTKDMEANDVNDDNGSGTKSSPRSSFFGSATSFLSPKNIMKNFWSPSTTVEPSPQYQVTDIRDKLLQNPLDRELLQDLKSYLSDSFHEETSLNIADIVNMTKKVGVFADKKVVWLEQYSRYLDDIYNFISRDIYDYKLSSSLEKHIRTVKALNNQLKKNIGAFKEELLAILTCSPENSSNLSDAASHNISNGRLHSMELIVDDLNRLNESVKKSIDLFCDARMPDGVYSEFYKHAKNAHLKITSYKDSRTGSESHAFASLHYRDHFSDIFKKSLKNASISCCGSRESDGYGDIKSSFHEMAVIACVMDMFCTVLKKSSLDGKDIANIVNTADMLADKCDNLKKLYPSVKDILKTTEEEIRQKFSASVFLDIGEPLKLKKGDRARAYREAKKSEIGNRCRGRLPRFVLEQNSRCVNV